MISIKETEVFGFRAALRDMRNPLESWDRSDSRFEDRSGEGFRESDFPSHLSHSLWNQSGYLVPEFPMIGPNDLELAIKLMRSGAKHRKFLRQIIINCFIVVPRYVWQEIDTYKVATVRNSGSTMHKLGHRILTEDDFVDRDVMPSVLAELNRMGGEYRAGGRKDYDLVLKMKRILPEGFLQRAGYHMSYETAMSMFGDRRNHRLPEWRFTGDLKVAGGAMSICDWIYSLPYMALFLEKTGKGDSDV